MCDEDKTSNSVQACSDLAHVVLVLVGVRRVRRVTVVHIGLEGVLVVVHFCVAILFVNCCIRTCSLYRTHVNKPNGEWSRVTKIMMINFAESGHPVFRATLERRELRSKEKGKKSIHFNGSNETVDLILRTVISVNQLSVHGAVEDLCKE